MACAAIVRRMKIALAAIILFALSGSVHAESGIASIYGNGDGYAWKCMAMQKRGGGCKVMNPAAMSAAHKTIPFGTRVTVVNERNGRQVVVAIEDRGPFVRGRIIDLTPAAALAIGCDGLCPVSVH